MHRSVTIPKKYFDAIKQNWAFFHLQSAYLNTLPKNDGTILQINGDYSLDQEAIIDSPAWHRVIVNESLNQLFRIGWNYASANGLLDRVSRDPVLQTWGMQVANLKRSTFSGELTLTWISRGDRGIIGGGRFALAGIEGSLEIIA